MPQTIIERACKWIVDLSYDDIPSDVIEIAKRQILDTFAAIAAGSRSTVGVRLKKALSALGETGSSTTLPHGEKWPLEQSIYYHAAMTNALELDNFSFMGHFSQSSVSVALGVGEKLNSSGKALLLALITAAEVSGRMGAYFAIGPQQGHMRSFIHRVGGAIASGKLLHLSHHQMTQAIAISLSMPEFTLFPAAFSPDTKVICTSAATVEGMRAAYMAKEGMDAAVDILESPVGFIAYLTYLKDIPDLWAHLGKSWNLYPISFKKYATCSYAQGPVNAVLEIRNKHQLRPEEIKRIDIYGPIVTSVMEKFSIPHDGGQLSPVNTHFSTKRSVSAAILFGELTGDFYRDGNFETKAYEIQQLAEKCHLHHEWQLTVDLIKGMDHGIIEPGKPGILSSGSAGRTLDRFKKAFGSRPLLHISDIFELKKLNPKDRKYILTRFATSYRASLPFLSKQKRLAYRSHEGDLKKMIFALSGRVKVTLKNGDYFEGYCHTPPGFAGDPNRYAEGEMKYFRETVPVWGPEKAAQVKDAIMNLENIPTDQLMQTLEAGKN